MRVRKRERVPELPDRGDGQFFGGAVVSYIESFVQSCCKK